MPYRKPYRKSYSRYRRKSGFKYGRKGFWKRKQMKNTGQTAKRFFKLKRVYPLSTSAGLITFTDNPRNPSSAQDWSSVAALFDSYRVCAVKYKFIPSRPNDTTLTTAYEPLYAAWDSDGTGPTSINAAMQYENLKIKNLSMPWSIYQYIGKIVTSGESTGYASTASPITTGEMVFLASGLNSSATYGQLIQTYYLAVKDRK